MRLFHRQADRRGGLNTPIAETCCLFPRRRLRVRRMAAVREWSALPP